MTEKETEMYEDQLRCPLPVVRLDETMHEAWAERYEDAKHRLDEGEMRRWLEENPEIERRPVVAVCGERVFVEGRTSADLTLEDLADSTEALDLDHYGNAWRVRCMTGHVLLVPDDQGNDDLPQLPLTPAFLSAALARLAPSA